MAHADKRMIIKNRGGAFMDRIMGGEIEYALHPSDIDSPGLSRDVSQSTGYGPCELFEKVIREMTHSFWPFPFTASETRQMSNDSMLTKTLLLNGGRAYFDTGGHLEYATPEACGSYQLLQYERAGDLLVARATNAINALLRDAGSPHSFLLIKNNQGFGQWNDGMLKHPAMVSYGAHENYLLSRSYIKKVSQNQSWQPLVSRLCPHIISRIFYTGNGWIRVRGDGTIGFSISQRARHITTEISSDTTSKRALLNTRDQAHADNERFFRLHMIAGDANLLEPALFLKYAATDMVLDMIEEDFLDLPFIARLERADASGSIINAFHTFSNNGLSATAVFGKRKYTMVDIQEMYCERANKFYETYGDATPSRRTALRLWEEVICLARQPRPHEALSSVADWAVKKVFLEKDMERYGYGWFSQWDDVLRLWRRKGFSEESVAAHVRGIDILFHELTKPGYGCLLRDHGNAIRRVASLYETNTERKKLCEEKFDAEVEGLITAPFPNSRPMRRTKIMREYLERKMAGHPITAFGASWECVCACDKHQEKFHAFLDPYDTSA